MALKKQNTTSTMFKAVLSPGQNFKVKMVENLSISYIRSCQGT